MHIIHAAAESHVGCVRAANEDNIYVDGAYSQMGGRASFFKHKTAEDFPGKGLFVFAVCDGMGGEAFGEKASCIAVKETERLRRELSEARTKADWDECVKLYVGRVNSAICDEIALRGESMGTTVALLCIKQGSAYFYNIGDSRGYIMRNGTLRQASQDHTVAQRLVRIGAITYEQAETHPGRNKLTQCLGTPEDEMLLEMYEAPPIKIEAGDIFLLCSDGLTEMCGGGEISRILSRHDDMERAAGALVNAAIKNGGHDNISVIAVAIK